MSNREGIQGAVAHYIANGRLFRDQLVRIDEDRGRAGAAPRRVADGRVRPGRSVPPISGTDRFVVYGLTSWKPRPIQPLAPRPWRAPRRLPTASWGPPPPGSAAAGRIEKTLVWQIVDRMLEIEFIDRGIAVAGKAFLSLFPLIIVVAAFLPEPARG